MHPRGRLPCVAVRGELQFVNDAQRRHQDNSQRPGRPEGSPAAGTATSVMVQTWTTCGHRPLAASPFTQDTVPSLQAAGTRAQRPSLCSVLATWQGWMKPDPGPVLSQSPSTHHQHPPPGHQPPRLGASHAPRDSVCWRPRPLSLGPQMWALPPGEGLRADTDLLRGEGHTDTKGWASHAVPAEAPAQEAGQDLTCLHCSLWAGAPTVVWAVPEKGRKGHECGQGGRNKQVEGEERLAGSGERQVDPRTCRGLRTGAIPGLRPDPHPLGALRSFAQFRGHPQPASIGRYGFLHSPAQSSPLNVREVGPWRRGDRG